MLLYALYKENTKYQSLLDYVTSYKIFKEISLLSQADERAVFFLPDQEEDLWGQWPSSDNVRMRLGLVALDIVRYVAKQFSNRYSILDLLF